MAWSSITDSEIAADKGVTTTLMTKIRDNLDHLHTSNVPADTSVVNGGFEGYDGATFEPTSWGVAKTDVTARVYDSDSYEGAAYYKVTQTALGGVCTLLSGFIICNPLDKIWWSATLKRNSASIPVVINIKFYDKAQTACAPTASVKVFDSATDSLPSSTKTRVFGVLGLVAATAIPADCKFVKIELVLGGGATSDKVIELDDVKLTPVPSFSAIPSANTLLSDAGGNHTGDTSPAILGSAVTIPVSGYYRVSYEDKYVGGACQTYVYRNSAVHEGDLTGHTCGAAYAAVERVLYFTAGDTCAIYGDCGDGAYTVYAQLIAVGADLVPSIIATKLQ